MSENAVWFECETCKDKIRAAKYWVRDNRWAVSAHSGLLARFFDEHAGWEHDVRVTAEWDYNVRVRGQYNPTNKQKESALDRLLKQYEVVRDKHGNLWIPEEDPVSEIKFTWEDVDLLQMARIIVGGAYGPGSEEERFDDLADRIAALLPPREP